MNIRTYIVKALYPLCSNEVQILIDQMQNNPDKFTQIFDSAPYRTESPWYRAMQSGNFELIDHVALRQQLRLLKNKYAKQLILEGLLVPTQLDENRNNFTGASLTQLLKDWTDGEPFPEKSQPSKIHMNKAQYDIAKKFADSEAAKQKLKANLQKAAR